MTEQLALQLEPAPLQTPENAFDVYVAPLGGQPEPTGPLPVLAPCFQVAEQLAAAAAGVSTERCLALPARHWSDTLIQKLEAANQRADADLRALQELHAEILGIPVDQLEARMATEKAEQDAARRERQANKPTRPSGRAAKEGDAIGIGRAALSDRQRSLLAHIKVENNLAIYTSAERIPDWDLLKRVMVALGGKWKTGGKNSPGGFRFPDDVDAAEVVRLAQESGEIIDPKAAEAFFTPDALADSLVDRLGHMDPEARVLEPSAGEGALVRALLRKRPGLRVTAIEALAQHVAKLAAIPEHGGPVLQEDFLDARPQSQGLFDAIAQNPPFSREIEHVRHAYTFLKPGGVLVAIMSAGIKYREDKARKAFRAWVAEHDGVIWENPEGSFEESGTSVRTVMVRMRRPA